MTIERDGYVPEDLVLAEIGGEIVGGPGQIGIYLVRVKDVDLATAAQRLRASGTVLFEGAQGMLLDEWRGFHPHTTWSSIGFDGAAAVLHEAGMAEPLLRLGVLRSHLTRHGAGPLPTHDRALDAWPVRHNASDGWQGAFRRGHPDALLLRYAIDGSGALDGLLLSHLDALQRAQPLRWCAAYRAPARAGDERLCERSGDRVTRLHLGTHGDLEHQRALTDLLARVEPCLDEPALRSADELVQRVQASAGCAVRMTASGATHAHVQWWRAAATALR
jgi:adenylosuccinate synthase